MQFDGTAKLHRKSGFALHQLRNRFNHRRHLLETHNHWVGIKLIGGAKSPRDAVGATVTLTAGGMRQRGDVMSGGSYESSNDQRLHFGLGQAAAVNGVDIRWPSGVVEHVNLAGVDRYFVVEEGKGVVPSVYDGIGRSASSITRSHPAGN